MAYDKLLDLGVPYFATNPTQQIGAIFSGLGARQWPLALPAVSCVWGPEIPRYSTW
jgi:hypothetical protein